PTTLHLYTLSLHDALPIFHDVISLRLPQYRTDPKMKAYLQLITRAAHKATLTITISQHAKHDIIDALKLPAERIRVIYEAAGDEDRKSTRLNSSHVAISYA